MVPGGSPCPGGWGCPTVIGLGGAEHLGIFVQAKVAPERCRGHQHVFHSPVIFVPRLERDNIVRVAEDTGRRLESTPGNEVFMIPLRGVGHYSVARGPLHALGTDAACFAALRSGLPPGIELAGVDTDAEAPDFVGEAVGRLIGLGNATSIERT